MVRLDKFLAEAGVGTRSEVKKYIQKGQVWLNGVCVKRPEEKFDPDSCIVQFQGQTIGKAPEYVYFLLHKPAGYVTATEDSKERTVMDLIHEKRKGLFPVGRLDKDTEGLLVITDDGKLSHQLLSPKKHVWKSYYARVQGSLAPDAVERVKQGMDIGDEKPTLPAELTVLSEDNEREACEILLRIHEGRFHQVKRMMAALGGEVVYLKRISMGNLSLPEDLPCGEYRELTGEERESLLLCGK